MKKDDAPAAAVKNRAQSKTGELARAIEEGMVAASRVSRRESTLFQVKIMEFIARFVDCDQDSLYTYEEEYQQPLALNFLVNITSYVNDSCRDCNDRAWKWLKEDECLDPSAYQEVLQGIGLKYRGMIRLGDESYRLPRSGCCFFEDADGFPLVIILTSVNFAADKTRFNLKVFANGRRAEAGRKVLAFIDGLDRYCREHTIFNRGVFTMAGKPLVMDPVGWEVLQISAEQRQAIDFHIVDFIARAPELSAAGLRSSRGIILCGKPGNGKTLLGRVLANVLPCPIIWVTARQLSGIDPLKPLDDLYRFAEYIAPAIIFMEDADIFLNKREANFQNRELLSEFLNRIDGIRPTKGLITIITANNPELLDQAVRNRPKRFDAIIEFTDPGILERQRIVEGIIGPYLGAKTHGLLESIGARLDGFTGAHVTEFAERLVMAAIYAGVKRITLAMVNQELARFGFAAIVRKRVGFAAS